MTRGAPWNIRQQDSSQTRTLLTNHRDRFVYSSSDEAKYWLGDFDWLLRLYQHHGLSRMSVQQPGGVGYFESEWAFLTDSGCEWLEYVNRHDSAALRLDYWTACRYGSWEPTPRGSMWVVPYDLYDTKE